MDPEVHRQLAEERRTRFLNLDKPEVRELWEGIRSTLEPLIKPDVDLDKAAEYLLIKSLMFASKDPLSGVANKAGIRNEVEVALTVANKLGLAVSVLYMDGRGFKEINDTLGHATGDLVIEAIGKGMRTSARRSTDITIHSTEEDDNEPNIEVGREGGDEFMVVLLGTDIVGTQVVAERMSVNITETVNEALPQLQQDLGHPFEITIGIAQYDPNIHHSGADLIKAADANLTAIRQQMEQPRRS